MRFDEQTSKDLLKLLTVTGPIEIHEAGITDGHSHVWIEPVSGSDPDTPILNDKEVIKTGLINYRKAGGETIVDCQPGGCGRDARVMRELSESSGVNIVPCTGYHLEKYYPDEYWIFRTSAEDAYRFFTSELLQGVQETLDESEQVFAGFIKIACRQSLDLSPLHLMEAAVSASIETGAAIEVHTEKGSDAENIAKALLDFGLSPNKLILCHMDKRPDFGLHRTLAEAGITLEYDTFFRPKYQPEENVWPLLERMIASGLSSQLVIATDMAGAEMWEKTGGGPGLVGLVKTILRRLEAMSLGSEVIDKLVGGNVAACLTRSQPQNI